MAFKCKTTAGPWTSRLTPTRPECPARPDGEIEVEGEDPSSGNFIGTHSDTGGLIMGKCTGSAGAECAGECKIEFQRRSREGDRLYVWVYEGNFKAEDGKHKTINGTYRKIRRGIGLGITDTVEEEGTWVGEKPIT